MHIELPQDLIDRLQERAAVLPSGSEADVIRKALDTLDWQDAERRAVQEGLDAMNAGDVQDFDQFDRDFRQQHGISPDE